MQTFKIAELSGYCPSVLTVLTPFKTCNMCKTVWRDCGSFVADRSLILNGYQAFFDNPEDGLILFTHRTAGCCSTLALKAGAFKSLYKGPKHEIVNYGAESCPGNCLDARNFEACHAHCSLHWVREILQMLRAHRVS